MKNHAGLRMRSFWIVAAYAAAGFIIGFVLLPLIPVMRALGWPRDTSVGITLFGLMPVLIVVAGVLYPRLVVNVLGVLAAILTWSAGYIVACMLMDFGRGSIGYNLAIMAPFTLPPYFVLTFLAFGLGRLRRKHRRKAT
ncbi:MAG: hypothetical protein ACYSUF_09305 [Planctomycetota bacterium]